MKPAFAMSLVLQGMAGFTGGVVGSQGLQGSQRFQVSPWGGPTRPGRIALQGFQTLLALLTPELPSEGLVPIVLAGLPVESLWVMKGKSYARQ